MNIKEIFNNTKKVIGKLDQEDVKLYGSVQGIHMYYEGIFLGLQIGKKITKTEHKKLKTLLMKRLTIKIQWCSHWFWQKNPHTKKCYRLVYKRTMK